MHACGVCGKQLEKLGGNYWEIDVYGNYLWFAVVVMLSIFAYFGLTHGIVAAAAPKLRDSGSGGEIQVDGLGALHCKPHIFLILVQNENLSQKLPSHELSPAGNPAQAAQRAASVKNCYEVSAIFC